MVTNSWLPVDAKYWTVVVITPHDPAFHVRANWSYGPSVGWEPVLCFAGAMGVRLPDCDECRTPPHRIAMSEPASHSSPPTETL